MSRIVPIRKKAGSLSPLGGVAICRTLSHPKKDPSVCSQALEQTCRPLFRTTKTRLVLRNRQCQWSSLYPVPDRVQIKRIANCAPSGPSPCIADQRKFAQFTRCPFAPFPISLEGPEAMTFRLSLLVLGLVGWLTASPLPLKTSKFWAAVRSTRPMPSRPNASRSRRPCPQGTAEADRGAAAGPEAGRGQRPVDARLLVMGRGQEGLHLGQRILAQRPAGPNLDAGLLAEGGRRLAVGRRLLGRSQGPARRSSNTCRSRRPRSTATGPATPAPSENHLYVPGSWVYRDDRYVWRPGYWSEHRPGWIWVRPTTGGPRRLRLHRWLLGLPAGRPRRAVRAGLHPARGLFRSRRTSTRRRYVVREDCLYGAFFCRRGYGSYYFGDYFSPGYASLGFSAWCGGFGLSVGFGGGWYDPLFGYYSCGFRGDPFWAPGSSDLYAGRYSGDLPLSAATRWSSRTRSSTTSRTSITTSRTSTTTQREHEQRGHVDAGQRQQAAKKLGVSARRSGSQRRTSLNRRASCRPACQCGRPSWPAVRARAAKPACRRRLPWTCRERPAADAACRRRAPARRRPRDSVATVIGSTRCASAATPKPTPLGSNGVVGRPPEGVLPSSPAGPPTGSVEAAQRDTRSRRICRNRRRRSHAVAQDGWGRAAAAGGSAEGRGRRRTLPTREVGGSAAAPIPPAAKPSAFAAGDDSEAAGECAGCPERLGQRPGRSPPNVPSSRPTDPPISRHDRVRLPPDRAIELRRPADLRRRPRGWRPRRCRDRRRSIATGRRRRGQPVAAGPSAPPAAGRPPARPAGARKGRQ